MWTAAATEGCLCTGRKLCGFSLVPLKMYLNGSLVKVEIGLVKGKQLYDKKKAIAEKDAERDKQRQLADMKR